PWSRMEQHDERRREDRVLLDGKEQAERERHQRGRATRTPDGGREKQDDVRLGPPLLEDEQAARDEQEERRGADREAPRPAGPDQQRGQRDGNRIAEPKVAGKELPWNRHEQAQRRIREAELDPAIHHQAGTVEVVVAVYVGERAAVGVEPLPKRAQRFEVDREDVDEWIRRRTHDPDAERELDRDERREPPARESDRARELGRDDDPRRDGRGDEQDTPSAAGLHV